jgi:hypothetical protein
LSLTFSKRVACDASAACRRTLRQARTFSSTTYASASDRVLAFDRQSVQPAAEPAV